MSSDLGCHLDGFIAPVATTMVVGAAEVTGPKADVIMAAYTAAEVALRMVRPGCKVCARTAPPSSPLSGVLWLCSSSPLPSGDTVGVDAHNLAV
jgi:hypothetical protein